ncbi:MAG: hypothetical protein KBD01_00715 [Acidobacteria bacterium]|nr:hypothetical protein [Acidobacteriota bacterium]
MRRAAGLLALLALAAAPARAGAVEVVPFTESQAGAAADLARIAPAVVERVARRLGLEAPERVLILVADRPPADAQGRARLGLERVPDWAAGVAQPARGRMVLFASRIGYPHDGLPGLLAHESAHLVFGAHVPAGSDVPHWYEEGLAMVVERDLSLVDALRLARVAFVGRPYALRDLAHGWPAAGPAAEAAYAQAFSVVSHATDHAAPGAERRLAGELARGFGFERAFEIAYGIDPGSLESAWRAELRTRYLYVPLLWAALGFNGVFGTLAVLAIAVARARRRRRLRAWAAAEQGEAPDGVDAPGGGPF